MPYMVTEDCIKCKYMDCVEPCPVDCFREGENMLVIDPDLCIDCAACETRCPVDAIIPDTDPRSAHWLAVNQKYALIWPVISVPDVAPADADKWAGISDKFETVFSPNPAKRDGGSAVGIDLIG